MNYMAADIEFDTSVGMISGAVAEFDCDTTYVRCDPECGDMSDRIEITSCKLISLQIGGETFDRYTVERMDKTELERIEAFYDTQIQAELDAEYLEAAE